VGNVLSVFSRFGFIIAGYLLSASVQMKTGWGNQSKKIYFPLIVKSLSLH
jgi:hypothetical protein